MKEVVKLEAYNIEQLVNLSGVKDENLEVLEDHFQVEISLRGDEMTLVGEKENLEKTKKVIFSLLKLIVSGVSISRRDVVYAQKLVEKDKLDQLSELYHIKIARTYNGKLISHLLYHKIRLFLCQFLHLLVIDFLFQIKDKQNSLFVFWE